MTFQAHAFRLGGTINETYYVFCECGWSTSVEGRGDAKVHVGQGRLSHHINDAYAEQNERLLVEAGVSSNTPATEDS